VGDSPRWPFRGPRRHSTGRRGLITETLRHQILKRDIAGSGNSVDLHRRGCCFRFGLRLTETVLKIFRRAGRVPITFRNSRENLVNRIGALTLRPRPAPVFMLYAAYATYKAFLATKQTSSAVQLSRPAEAQHFRVPRSRWYARIESALCMCHTGRLYCPAIAS
jgi:hypothetical protein